MIIVYFYIVALLTHGKGHLEAMAENKIVFKISVFYESDGEYFH